MPKDKRGGESEPRSLRTKTLSNAEGGGKKKKKSCEAFVKSCPYKCSGTMKLDCRDGSSSEPAVCLIRLLCAFYLPYLQVSRSCGF